MEYLLDLSGGISVLPCLLAIKMALPNSLFTQSVLQTTKCTFSVSVKKLDSIIVMNTHDSRTIICHCSIVPFNSQFDSIVSILAKKTNLYSISFYSDNSCKHLRNALLKQMLVMEGICSVSVL